MSTTEAKPDYPETDNGFFINAGTHSGWFKTPAGDIYDIRKLEPREVTDPRDGTVTTIWGGYAAARDRELAARDAILQGEFKKTGERPAERLSAHHRPLRFSPFSFRSPRSWCCRFSRGR